MNSQNNKKLDLYAECLKSILSFYDVQIDFDGLLNNIPKSKNRLVQQDVDLVCQKINFRTKIIHIPFSKLDKLTAPSLIILKDGPCIYYPDSLSHGRFVFPGRANTDDISFDDIKNKYTGSVIILSPKENQSALDIDHMKYGHSLDWFWQPIRSFWGKYVEIIICSIFINLLALAVPLFTMNVYDRVVINFAQDTLIVLTSGVIVALVFDLFFKVTRSYILERIAMRISVDHDYDLMERLMHIKDVDIGLSSGEKSNLFRELQGIRDFYASKLVPTLIDIPFFLLFTLIIYFISAPLAIVPIVAAVIIIIINLMAQIPVNRYTAEHFNSMQSKSKVLLELLGGIYTIKALNAAGYKLLKWKLAAENTSQSMFHNNLVTSVVGNISYLVTQIAYVSVIFLGVYEIKDGTLTVGGLIACSIIYSRAIGPVAGFSSILTKLNQSQDVLKTIDKIFKLPHEDVQSRQKSAKGPFKGNLLIEDLSFQYPGQSRPALYKNNLNIKAGEHIGIIGQTGAGKTTLSKIITGSITPSEGNISLDGYVYKAIAESELHRSIGYVPQDPFFFSGTIRENILMGEDDNIDKKYFEDVIGFSGLDLVMQQTGEGLDMEVGEGGKKLSGGQKQAISLARAMIRNPEVLVFDEPTTGMDSTLEARVKASLEVFIKDKTFIMVTHRSSLLSIIDRLVLVDKGRIIADGNRDEVILRISGR